MKIQRHEVKMRLCFVFNSVMSSFILTKVNTAFVFILSLYLATFIAKTPQMFGSSSEELWDLAKSVLGFCK